MATDVTSAAAAPDAALGSRASRHLALRISCWTVALALGAWQAWATRFAMNPDGVSYLDIGDAYWRGDWHNAINAYWSPLYSWILGFFLKVFHPSIYWEYPLVHLVNFFIYAGAMACFEFFLRTFVESLRQSESPANSFLWPFGYIIFCFSCLVLIGLGIVTPDVLVAGLFLLASAFLLRIQRTSACPRSHLFLGLVLGISYLAKAVMFPLSFVFLFASLSSQLPLGLRLRGMALAFLLFALLSVPFATAISLQKGHLTFGESASWTYKLYVDGMDYWPRGAAFSHPPRRVNKEPAVYEFSRPIAGTFPIWYDPTYWSEGTKPKFLLSGQLRQVGLAAVLYLVVSLVLFVPVIIGAFALRSKQTISLKENFYLILPSIATLFLYSLVHVETRFIAAQSVVLALARYGRVDFARSSGKAVTRSAVLAIGAPALILLSVLCSQSRGWNNDVYSRAAMALRSKGLGKYDHVGIIWNERWNDGAAEAAFVSRLARTTIVAEITDAQGYWLSSESSQQGALERIKEVHAKGVVAKDVPVAFRNQWERLADTNYFFYRMN